MSLIGIAGGVEVIVVVAFFLLGYVVYLGAKSESKDNSNLAGDGKKELDLN